jgi:hypothetical protein
LVNLSRVCWNIAFFRSVRKAHDILKKVLLHLGI